MSTLVVGMLIGLWLLVVALTVVAPWVADARRLPPASPAARRLQPATGGPAGPAARPAA